MSTIVTLKTLNKSQCVRPFMVSVLSFESDTLGSRSRQSVVPYKYDYRVYRLTLLSKLWPGITDYQTLLRRIRESLVCDDSYKPSTPDK